MIVSYECNLCLRAMTISYGIKIRKYTTAVSYANMLEI